MRIAFATLEYPPFVIGGAGKYVTSLSKELARLGHHVVVFAPRPLNSTEKMKDSGVEIVPVNVRQGVPFPAVQYWLSLPQKIARAENNARFDIIHFNGLCYWFMHKLSKAPHVTTLHHPVGEAIVASDEKLTTRIKNVSRETSPIYSVIEGRAITLSDKIIADSEYTRTRIAQRYSVEPQKIVRVYPSMDFQESPPITEELRKLREELPIPNVPLVLFVGRVNTKRKGLDLLLRAFRDVLASTKACLIVVGSGSQVEARELAAKLNLSDNVLFVGKVAESTLNKLYALCTVYVCPSRLEGFGYTLLEALAAGKPVVATNVGSIPEIVSDQNGSLVGAADLFSMSRSIIRYLESPALAETVGAYNARYVRRRFETSACARATEQVYSSLQ